MLQLDSVEALVYKMNWLCDVSFGYGVLLAVTMLIEISCVMWTRAGCGFYMLHCNNSMMIAHLLRFYYRRYGGILLVQIIYGIIEAKKKQSERGEVRG